jgi:translation initiation factor IF-2
MRDRGAKSADIAILIVSAEDGVKPQTLDALKSIQDAKVPFFIGVSKIDKPGADIEKTKQSLAENNIFVEGYGGDISFIPFSGKTGEGVNDLLDMIMLMSEVADIKAAYDVPAECIVIESGRDKIRGIHATMIVKNGTLKVGSFIVSGGAISPVRIVENFEGKAQKSFEPGQPVRLIGWVETPKVGDVCIMCEDKETAELLAEEQKKMQMLEDEVNAVDKTVSGKIPANIRALYGLEVDNNWTLPIVLKTDSIGTLDAVKQEIGKIKFENIDLRIIRAETGDINENDIKLAQGSKDSVIVGYNTKVDNVAKNLAGQLGLKIETFDIIYKLSEWLENEAKTKAPKILEEESHGTLKVLKIFNANKTKQVLGGLVVTGKINLGDKVKIMRRENEIGRGEIVELQHARSQVKTVEMDTECGLMIEAKVEIVTGDVIAAFSIVEK